MDRLASTDAGWLIQNVADYGISDSPDCLLIRTTAFEAVTFIKPPALPGVSDSW